MSDLTISKMEMEHVDQVHEIERASFPNPWSKDSFLSEVENERARYVVVLAQREVVGYGGMWLILDEAHVTNVAVHPQWRGEGIGRLIMQNLMTQARSSGAVQMTLEVRVSNSIAQGLYHQLGFEGLGVRKGYYRDNQEDALIMWCVL